MSTPPNGGNGAAVTLREVYALIKEVRSDLSLEIGKVVSHVDSKFSAHAVEHTDHEAQHVRDANARSQAEAERRSMIRWAVTSIIAAMGVAVAIWVAVKSGGSK
jgi:hypothetical protein